MRDKNILEGIDVSLDCFKRDWAKLSAEQQKEARKSFGEMILCERMPARLHFHKLSGFDVHTIHATRDDKIKASFKIEAKVAIMRRIGLHDKIDKDPE